MNIIPSTRVDAAACAVFLPERPNPPTDLELTDQKKRSVQLTWTPGDEHNSPVQSMFMCVCCLARSLCGFYVNVHLIIRLLVYIALNVFVQTKSLKLATPSGNQ